jgi:PGF-CTERM protein
MVLSYKGTKVDDIVVDDGDKSTKRVYTYVEKSISGKSDVPMFVTFVDSIFSGSTTDMVQLKYTWAISKDIVVVNSDQQFGSMKVRTASANLLMLDNENTITLNKDSVVDIASGMQFAVANDANNLRFYPKVDYLITGENATTGGTAVTTPIGNITPAGNKTNVTTTPAVVATTTPVRTTTEPTPTPTATKNTPGFEGVFAIAGLLAVAYLVLRQRK